MKTYTNVERYHGLMMLAIKPKPAGKFTPQDWMLFKSGPLDKAPDWACSIGWPGEEIWADAEQVRHYALLEAMKLIVIRPDPKTHYELAERNVSSPQEDASGCASQGSAGNATNS